MAVVDYMHDFLHKQGYLVKTWRELERENIKKAIDDGQLEAAIEERLKELDIPEDVKSKIRSSLKETIMRALDESTSDKPSGGEDEWPDVVGDLGKESK